MDGKAPCPPSPSVGAAGITIKIEATTILIAVGFSSAVGIFFGLYPARKAAKMLPIEALRRD